MNIKIMMTVTRGGRCKGYRFSLFALAFFVRVCVRVLLLFYINVRECMCAYPCVQAQTFTRIAKVNTDLA